MSRNLSELDRLFAEMDESGDLVDLDARQVEALRKSAEARKARRQNDRLFTPSTNNQET